MSTNLNKLNAQLLEAGVETIKDVGECGERSAYLQHLQKADWDNKEWVKKLGSLQKNHTLAFHKYVAQCFPYLLFEIGDDKTYFLYDEKIGVYTNTTSLTIKEKVISLLIQDKLNMEAREGQAKEILARFRAMYQERGVQYDDFDKEDDWFHVQNGWVNVNTQEFILHTPKMISRRVSGVVYDKDAVCPIYDKFLNEDVQLKADQVRVIDQFSGLLLTRDITKQKMLAMIGHPGCGKSTLVNVWVSVLGDCSTQKQLTELQGDSFRFAGGDLVGRTLCWFDEVAVKRSEMSNTLGNLITGQFLSVERKGINGIVRAKNNLKCVLTANSLPMSAEAGIYRRLFVIPFTRSFYDEEIQINDMDAKLLTESSGVLNRMLRGLADMKKMGGFTSIAGHNDLIEEYKASSDTIAEFLDAHFEPNKDSTEIYKSTTLQHAYKAYVGDRIASSITPQRFGKLLQTQPLDKFKNIKPLKQGKAGIRIWQGLTLRDTFTLRDDVIVSNEALEF